MNIYDEEILVDVEYYNDFLWAELRYEVRERNISSLNLDTVQLVLEPRADNGSVLCCYYFVNPASRSLFWLEEWDASASSVFNACRGVDTLPHKGETRLQWLTVVNLRCELNDF